MKINTFCLFFMNVEELEKPKCSALIARFVGAYVKSHTRDTAFAVRVSIEVLSHRLLHSR